MKIYPACKINRYEEARKIVDTLAERYMEKSWWQGVAIKRCYDKDDYYFEVRVSDNYGGGLPVDILGIRIIPVMRGGNCVATHEVDWF